MINMRLPWNLLPNWKSTSPVSHSHLVDGIQIHVRGFYLFCFGLTFFRQMFGDNIHCQLDGSRIGQNFIDSYCLINGTYTSGDPPLQHDYYQWVPMYLLFLAAASCLPSVIWSRYTKQYIQELTLKSEGVDACKNVSKLLHQSKGNQLFLKTVILETIYAGSLLLQVLLIDCLFNGTWSRSNWSWKTVNVLFPTFGSCDFDYMTGGGVTTGKFRCLLPLNIVYRKAFWGVYVLCVFLAIMHAIVFLYRVVQFVMFRTKVNVWWSLQVSKSVAKTWSAKTDLESLWKKYYDESSTGRQYNNAETLAKRRQQCIDDGCYDVCGIYPADK